VWSSQLAALKELQRSQLMRLRWLKTTIDTKDIDIQVQEDTDIDIDIHTIQVITDVILSAIS
jgi:hypothetical protein